MHTEDQNKEALVKQGMLPLFYHADAATCVAVASTLYAHGVRVIEFTNRGSEAISCFNALVQAREAHFPAMRLGVGTINTAADAQAFINCGADFLVSPLFNDGVFDKAYTHKVLWIPGCMTPTEIHAASECGLTLVKLFPGNVLGPGYVKAVIPLFPGMQYIVTGGVSVTQQSISEWFGSGVVAVGLGSGLISDKILANTDMEALGRQTDLLTSFIQQARQ